jgi:hypothetical protein
MTSAVGTVGTQVCTTEPVPNPDVDPAKLTPVMTCTVPMSWAWTGARAAQARHAAAAR